MDPLPPRRQDAVSQINARRSECVFHRLPSTLCTSDLATSEFHAFSTDLLVSVPCPVVAMGSEYVGLSQCGGVACCRAHLHLLSATRETARCCQVSSELCHVTIMWISCDVLCSVTCSPQ